MNTGKQMLKDPQVILKPILDYLFLLVDEIVPLFACDFTVSHWKLRVEMCTETFNQICFFLLEKAYVHANDYGTDGGEPWI